MLTEELEKRFPYARYHAGHRLVTWFPEGVLTDERADQMVEFLELAEMVEGQSFNRYMDMTGHTRIQIGLDHVVRIARRRLRYPGPTVKSAFYATRTISLSIASMYAELMGSSRIQVRRFSDRAAAADWLDVPVAILNSPKHQTQRKTPHPLMPAHQIQERHH